MPLRFEIYTASDVRINNSFSAEQAEIATPYWQYSSTLYHDTVPLRADWNSLHHLSGTELAALSVPTATADVIVNAKFPHMQVTDVFSFGVSKPFLWQNLRLQALNCELASAVSDTEIRILQTMAAGGDVTVPEILKALEPIELRFGVAAQGADPTVVHFELLNAGDVLPVAWGLSAQDSAGVETENWVEDAIPLNDAERQLQFIMEHRIFDFYPTSGILQPGDTCRLTVTYKHIAPGLHTLPLLLQVCFSIADPM